jgi:predicted N-acyltransferase
VKISVVENVDSVKWNELLESCLDATIFQTQEILDVYRKSFSNYKIKYIIAAEGDKIVCGMPILKIKRRVFCGYSSVDWGTPVLLDNNEDVLEGVLEKFSSLYNDPGISYLSVNDYSGKCSYLKNLGFNCRPCLYQVVELNPSFESMFVRGRDGSAAKVNKSRRKNAQSAIKRGVVVEEVNTAEQVKEYYDMARYTYASRGGALPYSLQFYKNILEIMFPKGLIKWHMARKDGTPIAATLHFVYKSMIFDLLDASYNKYQNLRANDLLVYNMIKWACENNFKYYNFGSSSGAEGLIEFKRIWGGIESNFMIYEKKSEIHKIADKLQKITGV